MKKRSLLQLLAFCPATFLPFGRIFAASPAETKPRVLTVFFSRSRIVKEGADAVAHATPWIGNTARVALAISKATGSDVHEIVPKTDYPLSHRENSKIAEAEMRSDARPELISPPIDISPYDVVFLGYPIWWYQEPMAVRTFLGSCAWKGKTIIPFCTSMEVGIEKSAGNIRRLCPGATVKAGRRFETGLPGNEKDGADWAVSQLSSL